MKTRKELDTQYNTNKEVQFTGGDFGMYTFGMMMAGLFLGNIGMNQIWFVNIFLFIVSMIAFMLALNGFARSNKQ